MDGSTELRRKCLVGELLQNMRFLLSLWVFTALLGQREKSSCTSYNTELVLTPSMVNLSAFIFILLNSLCKFHFKWCLFRNITLTFGSWKCNLSYLNSYGPLFNNSMTHYIFMCFMFIYFQIFKINLGGEILGNKLYTWITLVFPTVPPILLEWNHSYYVYLK